MDRENFRELLESYRTQDADDPIFADALRAVKLDPVLAAWFVERQRLDAVLAAKFMEVEAPAELKDRVLQDYRPAPNVISLTLRKAWIVPTAIAATLVMGLLMWHLLFPPPMMPLALQAIAYTEHMPALQFVCFDPKEVAKWVNSQQAAHEMGLKLVNLHPSAPMSFIGASVTQWDGRPVVMLCLQDGKRMAMVYVLNGDNFPYLKDGTKEIFRHADWTVQATKVKGQVHLLTSKGIPNDLDFTMPFDEGV